MAAFSYTSGLRFGPGPTREEHADALGLAMSEAARRASETVNTGAHPADLAEYRRAKAAYESYCRRAGLPAYATYDD